MARVVPRIADTYRLSGTRGIVVLEDWATLHLRIAFPGAGTIIPVTTARVLNLH